MYNGLPSSPAIQRFTGAAPDMIGVDAASGVIRGYVDELVMINGIAVRHPILVVEGLAFSLLLGPDILNLHNVMLLPNESDPLKLGTSVCDVCLERRTNGHDESTVAPLADCAASMAVIEQHTVALVQVRMPHAQRDALNIAVKPFASLIIKHGCPTLLAVCAHRKLNATLPSQIPKNVVSKSPRMS